MDSGLGSSVEIWKLECNFEIGGLAKKSDKTNKKSKILQLQGEIRELKINFFIRKKNEMSSKFQNKSMEFLIIEDIVLIFLLNLEIYCQGRFQKQSINQLNFLPIKQCIFEANCQI